MLRGYFDGGGLRKQNGHWQSGSAGVIPPTPTGNIVNSFILRICGGNYLQTNSGYSIITRRGRLFFVPYDKGTGLESWADDPAWDVGNNIGGSVYNHPTIINSRHDYRYVNAVVNNPSTTATQEQIDAFNSYVDEHGSATFHLSIKPHSVDADKRELEENLCIIGVDEDLFSTRTVEDFSPIPRSGYWIQSLSGALFPNSGIIDAITPDNVTNKQLTVLNLHSGLEFPNLWSDESLFGFKIEDELVVNGNPITWHLNNGYIHNHGFVHSQMITCFSFPRDYMPQTDISVDYLELECKIFYD